MNSKPTHNENNDNYKLWASALTTKTGTFNKDNKWTKKCNLMHRSHEIQIVAYRRRLTLIDVDNFLALSHETKFVQILSQNQQQNNNAHYRIQFFHSCLNYNDKNYELINKCLKLFNNYIINNND
jgi:acetyl-CoA carboxylase beta subunit